MPSYHHVTSLMYKSKTPHTRTSHFLITESALGVGLYNADSLTLYVTHDASQEAIPSSSELQEGNPKQEQPVAEVQSEESDELTWYKKQFPWYFLPYNHPYRLAATAAIMDCMGKKVEHAAGAYAYMMSLPYTSIGISIMENENFGFGFDVGGAIKRGADSSIKNNQTRRAQERQRIERLIEEAADNIYRTKK